MAVKNFLNINLKLKSVVSLDEYHQPKASRKEVYSAILLFILAINNLGRLIPRINCSVDIDCNLDGLLRSAKGHKYTSKSNRLFILGLLHTDLQPKNKLLDSLLQENTTNTAITSE